MQDIRVKSRCEITVTPAGAAACSLLWQTVPVPMSRCIVHSRPLTALAAALYFYYDCALIVQGYAQRLR